MDNNAISQILLIVLGVLSVILVILFIILIVGWAKKNQNKVKSKDSTSVKKETETSEVKSSGVGYGKKSIFEFMEFEKIEDNMIVQKNGKRYLMAIECQGVNYDLMSKVEKIAVEEGFQQFLNTLRHPIQIYIQTRTVNLENSINSYKSKVKEVEDKYNKQTFEYRTMMQSEEYTDEQRNKAYMEIAKTQNLLEYGKDIIKNTEKMSKNKNVLNKKFYIIVPYYFDQTDKADYAEEEIRNMAFSELYTKSQAIVRTLYSCSVKGKILSSNELAELLYVAYNRDESETYELDKALNAGVAELYATAPDVFDKKIKMLDEQIRAQAIEVANKHVDKAKSRLQKLAESRETNRDELIDEVAQILLTQNADYIGKDVAEEAIKELEMSKNTKEGEK